MTLSLYRPMRLAEAMNRLFDESFVRPYSTFYPAEGYALPLDVVAKDDEFVITAAVPGLRPEDLNVEVLDTTVTIRGEIFAPQAPSDEKSNWLLQERHYGKFNRTVNFSAELDGAKTEASVENGLLSVRIPKSEAAKPKMIKVKAK